MTFLANIRFLSHARVAIVIHAFHAVFVLVRDVISRTARHAAPDVFEEAIFALATRLVIVAFRTVINAGGAVGGAVDQADKCAFGTRFPALAFVEFVVTIALPADVEVEIVALFTVRGSAFVASFVSFHVVVTAEVNALTFFNKKVPFAICAGGFVVAG